LSAKRLTRKQIVRKDPIQQTLTETSSWVVRNRNYLVAAVLFVLLAVASVYLWQMHQQSRQATLQTEFADALAKYHASVDDESNQESEEDSQEPQETPKYRYATTQERAKTALEAFRLLADEYSNSRLGDLSRYYAALCLIDLERTKEAESELETVITDSKGADIRNLARNCMAQLAISEEESERAIRYLQQIMDEPSQNFPKQMTLMRMAESYETAGNRSEALALYRQITSEYSGSAYASQAENRVKRLELRGTVASQEGSQAEEPPTSGDKED
jgi:predicted negative regulator of RcsB-dependent stress response